MTTQPRGGAWLTDELHDLAMADVDVLVSLLTAQRPPNLSCEI
jgi:hypothetical protein